MPRDYDDRWRDRGYDDADGGAERRRPRSRSRERDRHHHHHHHHHHHRSSHHDHDRDRDRDRDRDYRRGDRDGHYGRRRSSRSRSRSRSRGRGYDEPPTTAAPTQPQPPSRPGIFQYIASATGNKAAAPNAPPPAPLAAPAFPEDRPKPNADRLGAMLRGDERMNRRMDERERSAARERLRGLDEGEREGRYRGDRGGRVLIRDGFSKGVVDRVAAKKRPYQCDAGACEQSFAISVELVEHLRRAHGIHRHPSQIVAKPVLP